LRSCLPSAIPRSCQSFQSLQTHTVAASGASSGSDEAALSRRTPDGVGQRSVKDDRAAIATHARELDFLAADVDWEVRPDLPDAGAIRDTTASAG
jgi:hypothetical protein